MTRSALVYVLIPVHNRREVTLACLRRLQRNGDLERCTVVVIDDGSTDGTAAAIKAAFPTVIILQGDGHLWWTGAIRMGMEYAYSQAADYFVWLNDDTLPSPEALSRLVGYCRSGSRRITTAQCYATEQLDQPTYGGQWKHRFAVELFATPPGMQNSCDCMSGNLVCFPRSVVDEIGYPPAERLPHCRADIVYTLRAKRAGYDLQVLGDATAVCSLNPLDQGWSLSPIPMGQRWRQLLSLKSNIYPPTYWVYCQEVFGTVGTVLFVWVYVKLIAFTLIRGIMPLAWLKRLKAYKDARLKVK